MGAYDNLAVRLDRYRPAFVERPVAPRRGAEVADDDAVFSKALVQVANLNSQDQVVVAGTTAGLAEFQHLVSVKPEYRCIPLNTPYAFHSDLMKPVWRHLKILLEHVTFACSRLPIISNADASEVREGEAWRCLILQQLFSKVCWKATLEKLISLGIRTFIEVGPSEVQLRFVRQLSNEAHVFSTRDCDRLSKLFDTAPGSHEKMHLAFAARNGA